MAALPKQTILERLPSSIRMREHDEVGKITKKLKRPKKERRSDITNCFVYAYEWGVEGVCNYKWEAFNIGINNGEAAGQTVMWPHVHLIPRREGDVKDPKRVKGGVRHVIPLKGYYEEEDDKKKYKGYREWKKKIPMENLAHLEEEYNMKGNDE